MTALRTGKLDRSESKAKTHLFSELSSSLGIPCAVCHSALPDAQAYVSRIRFTHTFPPSKVTLRPPSSQ
eukprot:634018-Rhodomonas_salina.1